jgi:hypothetical protein
MWSLHIGYQIQCDGSGVQISIPVPVTCMGFSNPCYSLSETRFTSIEAGIPLYAHSICLRTRNKRLACKQSVSEKAPSRLLHLFEYSSKASGKEVDSLVWFLFIFKMIDKDAGRWESEISV